ncbi:hypothetical protein [Streptomyces fulvoviolaceus]|uniref:hypothetical protein n=1 Tax=Streptomyces fulvoviolaceus TaxID=285535 RepID=UPI0021BE3B17|nr:hypothetical protein [Streptomyces fulvoviolaceus]MCT9078777.1 hypothetical protein [Streptomyces fulvoviolaceus]
MAKPDEGRAAEIQARTFAIMLVALDGQAADVEPLLDDLSAEDVGDVAHGLASMALLSMLKREDRRDPVMRARLGEQLRGLILERQSRAQG